MKETGKANHLRGQSSPYLRQHLYNPVDWHPWGEAALRKAREEGKPILVSIGYSACHWCHVMEKESFEDPQIAALMNTHFVCIKVDREERPDIDHLYMNAVQLLSGRGGWPLNCFALADARPFWGGTYFPPEQWNDILIRIAELHQTQKPLLEEQATQITEGIAKSNSILPSTVQENLWKEEKAKAIAQQTLENMDFEHGGTLGAPKFPLPGIHEYLLHYHTITKESKSRDAVELSLQKMAMGGIYDQVGGGFARYATDKHWKVPHFEKMLYDNAQLISLYATTWRLNPKNLYQKVVYQSIEFALREFLSPDNTFYSALDADSEGEEGKYYVWHEHQINALALEDPSLLKAYYQIGGEGLWEKGQNILLRNKSDEAFAQEHMLGPDRLERLIQHWNTTLLKAREQRIKPGLDDKIIISWNAMMITGLVDAFQSFRESAFLNQAEQTARFILQNAIDPQGRLCHTLVSNKPGVYGFLEDYAAFIQALIRLYQLSFNESYLLTADLLAQKVFQHFMDQNTNLFRYTPDDGEQLAATWQDYHDNVAPSANSTMARNLFYLGHYMARPAWLEHSQQMLRDIHHQIEQLPAWTTNWNSLLLHHTWPYYQIVICGPEAEKFAETINKHYLPQTLIAATNREDTQIPLLQNKWKAGKTLIYPCYQGTCLQPLENPDELLDFLKNEVRS